MHLYLHIRPLSDLYRPRRSSGSVPVIGRKIRGFKPAEDDGFIRAIKIRWTTSFGEEVKPSDSCKILPHVKGPYEYGKG
jgi:hypothetical protein